MSGIYTLRDLRALAPKELRNASDSVLINEYAKDLGADPVEVARYLGYNNSGGMARNRIAAGVDNYQANMYGLGGAVARTVGADRVAGWMDQRREANELDAATSTVRARELGAVDDWREIGGVGDAFNFVGGLAAQSAPYLAEAAVGGLAARGLMTGTRAALATAQTPQAAAAARRALNIGSMAGAVGVSYPSAVGDVLSAQRDEGGPERLGSAMVGGVPYAALNAIGAEGLVARGLRPIGGSAERGMLARMGREGGKTALTEGVAETGQEGVNQYFGRMAVNPEQTFFNDEANTRYLDAFISGAALGGAIGPLGGVRRPIEDFTPFDLTQRSQQAPAAPEQGPTPRLGYSPLAGTPIVFPDGSVALNGEQELQGRYGAGVLNTPTAAPGAVPTAPAAEATKSDVEALNRTIKETFGIDKPNKYARQLYETMQESGWDPMAPELEMIWSAAAQSNYLTQKKLDKLLEQFDEVRSQINDSQNVVAPPGGVDAQPGAPGIPALPTAATPDAAVAAVSQPPTAGAGQPAGAAQNTADQGAVNRVVSSGGSTAASLPTSASAGVGVSSTQTDGTQTAQAQQAAPQGSTAASIRPAAGQPTTGAPTAPVEAVGVVRPLSDGFANDAEAWDEFRPDDAPSFDQLPQPLQQAWQLARRQGKLNLALADEIAQEYAADDGASRDETVQLLTEVFGERDAGILTDVMVNRMTEEAVAQKYGVSRATVSNLAGGGTEAKERRGKKIAAAIKRNGWEPDYIQNALASFSTPVAAPEMTADMELDANEGVGANDMTDADGVDRSDAAAADPTLGQAGFTVLSAGKKGAGNWKDGGARLKEMTEPVRAKLNELLAERTELEKLDTEEAAAQVEAIDAEISQLEAQYVSPREVAAGKTQAAYEAMEKAEQLRQSINDAIASGSRTVATSQGRVGLKAMEARVAAEIERSSKLLKEAEAILQRGKTREKLGAEAQKTEAKAKARELVRLTADKRSTKDKNEAAEAAGTKRKAGKAMSGDITDVADDAVTQGTEVDLRSDADRAAAAWDKVAVELEGAPLFDELTKDQQETFIDYGEGNWTKQDVLTELAKIDRQREEAAREGAQFGKDARATNPFPESVVQQPVYHATQAKFDPSDMKAGDIGIHFGDMWQAADRGGLATEGRVFDRLGPVDQQNPRMVGGALERVLESSDIEDRQAREQLGKRRMLKFFINLKNPLVMQEPRGGAWHHPGELRDALIAAGVTFPKALDNFIVGYTRSANNITAGMKMPETQRMVLDKMAAHLKSLGYDGIQYTNKFEGKRAERLYGSRVVQTGNPSYIVFDKSQISRPEYDLAYGETDSPTNAYTAKELEADLKSFMRVDALGRNVIIVDKPTDLEDIRDVVTGLTNIRAFGWTRDGKAVLVASRIQKGMGRAKFMHEVGSHLGMQRMLPPEVFNRLVDQVIAWGGRSDNSLETRLAKKAMARVPEDTAPASVRNEIVAYFVEEAVMAGVDPTAARQLQSPVMKWYRSLVDAFKRALVKLGVKPESLRANDYVNLAYGAASLRLDTTPSGSSEVELGSQAVTDTPAFKRWFGDSKVVGADGKPLVMYHATQVAGRDGTGISVFEPGVADAIFVTPDVKFANKFRRGEGVNIIPLYVKASNPFDYEDPRHVAALREKLDELFDSKGKPIPDSGRALSANGVSNSAWPIWQVLSYPESNALRVWPVLEAEGVQQAIRALGHDGFYVLENGVKNLGVYSSTQLKSAIGNRGTFDPTDSRIEFGMNPPKAPTRSAIERNVASLPKPMQGPVRNTLLGVGDVVRKVLDRVVFTNVLIDRAVNAGIKSADKFSRLLYERSTKARELEREVEKIADMYTDVEVKDKGDGDRSLNRFLFESTRQGKWGYGSKADPEMKDWFDSLGDNSQKLVKAIFAHGDKVLAQKKQAVLDWTNSEYDALIKAAQIEGNAELEAELKRDKANSLKKFETLFKIREGQPYAPIKRMGNHVVVAKSEQYRTAEAAGDTAELRKLEKDPDHYHVSFVESKNEARRLADRLREQGFYGRDDAAVEFFERSANETELFGGESMLQALTKLRNQVDERDGKGTAQLQKMVTELWLNALAEDSARKSEMRRKGVDGEVDMLRSFAAQGRADAQFIASVEYNPQTQDTIQAMRNEAKRGGNRDRKSEIMNELMERYAMSMDVTPNPTVDKITRMSSVYFLASSPMYYLQNLTQPWMMSVPAMAGNHDYTKVSSELFKAYSELGPVLKSGKLFETQFDFTKVPADVRDAIQKLVNRGRIDIGLDTELGEFRIDGEGKFSEGWNKVDKGLRLLVQKGEAINRLSTAITAYRLELARTGSDAAALDYADKILLDTHGDYGRFNAPKYFNYSLGRVALQFRKFQLIQLTFYAKLIKDAFTNPAERKTALKSLSFALGHTALMAGAMGLPGYAAIAWVLGHALGDDDEKFDLTNQMRKLIGNEDMANLIMRGAPTLAGADISGKVGAGTMLSIMPFSNADISTPRGQAEAWGTLLGGASLGMASRVADGLGLMMSGDWMRGAELVLPKGLGDAIKGYRVANEGLTRRNGDVILPASEVSAVEALMTAIGMSPVETTVTYERRNRARDVEKRLQDRATRIKNDYAKAARRGDTDGIREAREAWVQLQDARARNGFTRQPLSNLLRAPQEQAKRERNTAGGVQFNNSNRRFAEDLAST